MLYDTDILIWVQRGNDKAAHVIDEDNERCISIFTYMELLQCAKNKIQHIEGATFKLKRLMIIAKVFIYNRSAFD
jgi:predicted nucleic acid-binding protein